MRVSLIGLIAGRLPGEVSFVEVEQRNVRLTAKMEAFDGWAIAPRHAEREGRCSDPWLRLGPCLCTSGQIASAVDTLELPLGYGNVQLQASCW